MIVVGLPYPASSVSSCQTAPSLYLNSFGPFFLGFSQNSSFQKVVSGSMFGLLPEILRNIFKTLVMSLVAWYATFVCSLCLARLLFAWIEIWKYHLEGSLSCISFIRKVGLVVDIGKMWQFDWVMILKAHWVKKLQFDLLKSSDNWMKLNIGSKIVRNCWNLWIEFNLDEY